MSLRLSHLLVCSLLVIGCRKKTPEVPPEVVAPVVSPTSQKVPDEVVNLARNFTRVFFDFDSSNLSESSKSALNDNVKIMQARPDIKLEIQGHADERGTTDYNIALGQRRADSVYRYMKAQGIADSRLKVVSYGEERPLRSGGSETAWSQNRRCEFIITWSESTDIRGTADK